MCVCVLLCVFLCPDVHRCLATVDNRLNFFLLLSATASITSVFKVLFYIPPMLTHTHMHTYTGTCTEAERGRGAKYKLVWPWLLCRLRAIWRAAAEWLWAEIKIPTRVCVCCFKTQWNLAPIGDHTEVEMQHVCVCVGPAGDDLRHETSQRLLCFAEDMQST